MNISRTKLMGLGLVIFAGALWLHWPNTKSGFLREDDLYWLAQSARWNGLTWNAVKWAFTRPDPYYDPLPRLSHVLDYQIWGKNAAGRHATSVVVHALNAALVFGFLWTLLGATSLTTGERLMVALWVAVVFAIHPLQVESVAWMSVRNTLLCTMFGIGSMWAYAAGARRWLVWALFVAALLCKPIAVSFPFVMLAMDYYPLRRHERFGWGRLLWEKVVLIALAVVAAAATLVTESPGPYMVPLAVSLPVGVFRMCESLMFYALKVFLASASGARLSDPNAPVAQSVAGAGLGAWCRHYGGGSGSWKATHNHTGGGFGGVRSTGSSRFWTRAMGIRGGVDALRLRGDAAAAAAGGWRGGLVVAAFEN